EPRETDLRDRGDRDAAARLLLERHGHVLGGETECLRDVVADLDRQRLTEDSLVSEAVEVQLERLRFEAMIRRAVVDRSQVEIRLAGDRADRDELVAGHLDPRDAWIGKGLDRKSVV